MQVKLIEKNAMFLFDKQGVIIITDIEKDRNATLAEFFYDGKNVAILNRNNKEFFSFKNIAPLIRERIKESKYVTIIEKDKDDIYSYQVEVHLKDDLGFEDDFEEYAQKVVSKLKEKMSPEDFEKLVLDSEKFIQEVSK